MEYARRPLIPAIVLLCSLFSYSQHAPTAPVASVGPHADQRTAHAAQSELARRANYVEDQLLVRFRRGADKLAIQAEHAQIGAQVLKQFHIVDNLQLVRLPAGMPLKQAMRYYRGRIDVLYAEPNYIRRTTQSPITPNDPRFPEMWNLLNTGQSGGKPGADIHAPEAWSLTTGTATVVVGVIDSGIDYSHPDLSANMFRNSGDCNLNGADDDRNGYVDDCYGIDTVNHDSNPMDDFGHGTHVAGTIGAAGNNGNGVVGVNWQVQIIACKFLDSSGSGTSADLIACLQYFATMKDRGVNLVATNNSYGGTGSSQAEVDAIDAHRERGILFIAAAGNSRTNSDLLSFYPAKYDLPNIIAVAATDRMDALASFSNFGRHTVHVAAPGEDILSTVPGNLYSEFYEIFSGTSMAAPHVTGVAALLKAQDPTRDWKAIKNLILAGGDVVPGAANTISRRRLNAYGSMTCSNKVLQSRLQPMDDDVYVSAGDSLAMRYLNVNCAAPNGTVEVRIDGGSETIIFADDGVAPDLVAGDGVYVATRQWLASEIGDHTLVFPNNDVVTVHVISALAPYSYSTDVPFNYREIAGVDLSLGDDDSAIIRPPFPVQFGGVSFPTLRVNSNGNVTFFAPFVEWENTSLPAQGAATLVSPFWDDIYGTVQWGVIGSAPNRELVIEWVDPMAMTCMFSDYPSAYGKFQIVFFESSSDILFNYANVMLGTQHVPNDEWWGCISEENAGASATVGVQSASNLANQFSFNTPSLSNESAILWRIGHLTPAITQLFPVNAAVGAPAFSLQVQGRSFLPEAVVRWNGHSLPTTFISAGELTANVSAADVAAPATAQVTVFNPAPNGSGDSVAVPFPILASNPVPTLTSVIPDTLTSLREMVPLVVNGADFTTSSVARWNGMARTTTVLSSTQLQVTPLRNDTLVTGTVQLTVINQSPGGGVSNALPIHVVNPAPQLSSVFPAHVGAGNGAFTLQLSGDGFAAASVVRWNGSDRPTTLVHQTHQLLTAEIPATDVASVGSARITVFNPTPGGGVSEASPLAILTPPANDNFAQATIISRTPFVQTEDASGATPETGDPSTCVLYPPQQQTVWFAFTPATAGAIITAQAATNGELYYQYQWAVSAWSRSNGRLVSLGCNIEFSAAPTRLSVVAPSTEPIYFMVSATLGAASTLAFSLDAGSGFTLAATPGSNSVSRGTPANYTITVSPQGGSFNNPIALSCSVAPVGPTCSLSTSSVTPGNTATPVTLTVATTNVALLHRPGESTPLFAFLAGLPVLGLLAACRILPSRKRRNLEIFAALVLIVTLLGIQAACGGGGSGSVNGGGNDTNGTQTRNYVITVTGTSGAITQQTSAALTVTF